MDEWNIMKFNFIAGHLSVLPTEKDTVNPLSHQVMASLKCLSWTQALAPENKKSSVLITIQLQPIWATNATKYCHTQKPFCYLKNNILGSRETFTTYMQKTSDHKSHTLIKTRSED